MTFATLNPVPLQPYDLTSYSVAPTSATVTRSAFSAREQLISRDLIMVSPVGNGMDVDPGSSTWGRFNAGWWRSNWQLATNARIQESVLTLSWFYAKNRTWNPYYRDANLARRIIAGIQHYINIQQPDGGWTELTTTSGAAATGFALGHLALTWRLLDGTPLDHPSWWYWRVRLRASLLRACTWALNPDNTEQWEHGGRYSNQLIASLAGIARIRDLLTPTLETKFQDALTRLPTVTQGTAGYLFEDYGADFGYTTSVALPYLAYLYQVTGNAGLLTMAQKAFEFISYNVLWEPDSGDGSFMWNDAPTTRTPLPYSSGTKSDEAGMLDGAGLLRASTTIANAMLTSAEGKAAQRAAWVATAGAITPIAATQVSPYRIHRVTDVEDLPTAAQKAAALAALPCKSATQWTAYKTNGAESGTAAEHRYLYVKHSGYYAGATWGRWVTGARLGLGFFYHPAMGTIVCGQRNSEAYWGAVAGAYGESLGTISSSTTPPSDGATFTLSTTAVSSTRSVTFSEWTMAITATKSGSFVERLPMIIWDTDIATFNLTGGGTITATTADTAAASATSMTLLRPGRGTFTLTPSAAASMTLYAEEATATRPTSTKKVRRLEISASESVSYTITAVPA